MKHLFAACLLATTSLAAAPVERIDQGVIVTPDSGPAKRVRVLAYGDGTFRVTALPDGSFDALPSSLMVVAKPHGDPAISESEGTIRLRLPKASAEIRVADGHVRVLDAGGKLLLDEAARGAFKPVTLDGKAYLATSQQFNRGTDEGFYGLGQHQNAQMNYNGEDVELAQHNMDIAIPFVVSTRNYGLLWDNNSITRFGNPTPYAFAQADKGWKADYYLGDKLTVSRTEPTINYGRGGGHGPEHCGQCGRKAACRVERHDHAGRDGRPQIPPLRLKLFQGLRRRKARARSLAPELESLVP
jgi:alpha-D-xyloside xylohydrolase